MQLVKKTVSIVNFIVFKTERLIINIQSTPDVEAQHYQLDWFETSIYTDFSRLDDLISEIKNNLSFPLKESSGNQFYFSALRNDNFGFAFLYDLKPKLKNSPFYLKLTGQFFKLHRTAQHFLNWFLNKQALDFILSLTRVDAAIDLISFDSERDIPTFKKISGTGKKQEIKFFGFLDGLENFKEKLAENLSGFIVGSGDSRLRIYNKLKENPFYSEEMVLEGVKSVWRVEHQFRGEALKGVQYNLQEKKGKIFTSEADLMNEVLGQMARRYEVERISLEPSEISSYVKKEKDDFGQINFWMSRALSAFKKYDYLVKKKYYKDISANRIDNNGLDDVRQFAMDFESALNDVPF